MFPFSKLSKSFVFCATVVLAGLTPKSARAQATLLLEEPYSYDGTFAGTGHAAVYLARVCAESPTVLRRCGPGETGIVISANEYFRDCLGQEMFQKLEILREQITSIVALRHISVLESVLDLPVQSLKADQEVFVGKPVCVRDAFFSAECDRHFSDSCGKHHRTPARQSDHFRCGTTGWRS